MHYFNIFVTFIFYITYEDFIKMDQKQVQLLK